LNNSGQTLAQEDKLQFAGYLRTSDDSTNGKTVVTDAPEEVTWAVWQTMTDEQKTGHHWFITDAPTGADSVRYFSISSSGWVANTGSDAAEFPYVYTIASTAYGADFVPAEVLLLGSSSGDYPSASEEEDIALVDKYIKFTATAIRLRATGEPTNNLTLVIRDGSSSGATDGGVLLTETWEAGETTVEFSSTAIDGNAIFDVYLPSEYCDLVYSSLSVSGHTLTITFPSAQASDIEVKLRVNRG
jgi:hypothetical protein